MSRQRLEWVDAARGICVAVVVASHLFIWLYRADAVPALEDQVWNELTDILGSFILPMLFAISGLMASPRIRRGWADAGNAGRVIGSYYLYVVWLVVYALISIALPTDDYPFRVTSFAGEYGFLSQLLLPHTILWFVFALALYTAVLTSLRRLPSVLVVGALAVLSVSTIYMPGLDHIDMYLRVVYYAFFFALGVHAPTVFGYFSAGRVLPKLVASLALFVVLRKASGLAGDELLSTVVRLAADATAVFAGVAAMVLLSRVPLIRRGLGFVGRETLPIYVMQLPVIWVLLGIQPLLDLFAAPVSRSVALVVVTVLVLWICIGLHRLMARTPLRVLFAPPTWLVLRLVRPAPHRSRGTSVGSTE